MSSGIDINFIKDTYSRMPDEELIRIATSDAHGLTPEAIEVINVEIKKRGLDEKLNKGIEAQNREYTIQEIDAYCELLRDLNCPICGNNTERLNATLTCEVISFVFFTTSNNKIYIGCPNCLDNANNKALTKTVLLGWWGIPWGLIKTPKAIVLNMQSKRIIRLQDHSDHMRSFVLSTIGELETYRDNKEKLQQILISKNGL